MTDADLLDAIVRAHLPHSLLLLWRLRASPNHTRMVEDVACQSAAEIRRTYARAALSMARMQKIFGMVA